MNCETAARRHGESPLRADRIPTGATRTSESWRASLARDCDIPYYVTVRNLEVKGGNQDLEGRFWSNAKAVLASIVLFFPNSLSVLCIGPNGHVAVEDMNAGCCAPSAVSVSGEVLARNALAAEETCGNCRDLFLTPNGRVAVVVSRAGAAADPQADAAPQSSIGPPGPLPSDRSGMPARTCASAPVFPSVPLRC
jgi:hypothetical protein